MLQYYLAFLPLLFFALFALLLFVRKWMEDRRCTRTPSEKLLRTAGESRKAELKRSDEIINNSLMYIGIGVAAQIIVFNFSITVLQDPIRSYLIAIASTVTIAFALWHLIKTMLFISKRKATSDGYLAERMAGEYLNTLMLDGYRVFHDLQLENLNIDHVAVGPAGIFAFETQFKAIPKTEGTEPIARFDGRKLKWPNGKETEIGIQQAIDRSVVLQQYLSQTLGGTMEVQPVLLFPSWTIEVLKKGRVDILNPKHIRAYLKGVGNYNESMAENLINKICGHLAELAGYQQSKAQTTEEPLTESKKTTAVLAGI